MKLIKPGYNIITKLDTLSVANMLLEMERFGRISHLSEPKIEGAPVSNAISFIKKWGIDANHQTILEAVDLTVEFIIDRGVSHELVRHRLTSPMQESTRYCNYSKDKYDNQVTFIIPNWLKIKEGTYTDLQTVIENTQGGIKGFSYWASLMLQAELAYNFLIEYGWQPQEARSVLPNSLKTKVNIKTNIREWRDILIKRTNSAAHPQMREVMCPLLDELKTKIPIIFDDINY
jgi:thymidylate synthase (FAD)